MWIGVLSDSAGVLAPRILDIFDGVDYILHCGNIGDVAILEDLSQIAPVSGVIGTSDTSEELPFERTLFRKWFDVGIYVVHRLGDPANLARTAKQEIDRHDPEVILYGRNEGSYNSRIDNRLFFNPGPATNRRGRNGASVGILEIDGRLVRGEIVPLAD